MKISKALAERIEKAVSERVDIVSYDPSWSDKFLKEKEFLLSRFPDIIKRVEHFGSTAVPGLSSKPVVDMLIEVTSHNDVAKNIIPILDKLGYEYFHRGEFGGEPPLYDWFIKRNKNGTRSHHLHMVKKNSKLWERLYFRDYLKNHPEARDAYGKLKTELSQKFPNDREAYTKAKGEFIRKITEKARSTLQQSS